MAIELDYSIEVLEEAPARAARLLQGIGAMPVVRTLLAEAGMTAEDITEGRTLLLECLAEPVPAALANDTADAKAVRAAVSELDQWDEANFQRYGAALKRQFRSANEFVFKDLKPSNGRDAVQGVALFLTRVKALADGSDPGRTASKADDAKAAALLATRGLTVAERTRLDALVALALGPTEPLAPMPPQAPSEDRLIKLSKLRAWFDDWSSTARAVVKKRGSLIRLGLAKRKGGAKDDVDDVIAPVA